MHKILSISISCIFILSFLFGEKPPCKKHSLYKTKVDTTGYFDGNRISNAMENNGIIVSDYSGHSGLEWPKGSGIYSIYASSVWFAGKVDGEIRTATGDYSAEMVPGPWGSDPETQENKFYKVNKSDMDNPAANQDFQNWPWDLGAPWVDVDGNGTYNPLPNGPDHPEFVGDQVIWYVANDGGPGSHDLFGTRPLGLEVQYTIYGTNRTDVTGDMMFVNALVINKGGNEIEDMYIGLWSDPDLGDAGDDFAGCDTTLSLGICYNDGQDQYYGNNTPAVGYDLFQGPIVPSVGDTAFSQRRYIADYKNLPMTSFMIFSCGSPVYYDPNDAEEVYNNLSGLLSGGTPIPFEASGGSPYMAPGDPTKNTGPQDTEYVDSDINRCGDKRFLMGSGPFEMTIRDTQEIVFGIIIASRGTALESYQYLKEIDRAAQAYYKNIGFSPEMAAPNAVATPYPEEIILTWDDQAEKNNFNELGDNYYRFEGYNVYQLDSPLGLGETKKIATYDLINGVKTIFESNYDPVAGKPMETLVQVGNDSGIKREILITGDAFNQDSTLLTNREYYFAVTAYAYDPFGLYQSLESEKKVISVRPQIKDLFTKEDTVNFYNSVFIPEHTSGWSSGIVNVRIVNPLKLSGDDYEVTFLKYIDEYNTQDILSWQLTNTTQDTVVVENSFIVDGIDEVTGAKLGNFGSPVTEGFQVLISSDMKGFNWIGVTENAAGVLDPIEIGAPYWWDWSDWLPNDDWTGDAQQSTTDAWWMINLYPGYVSAGQVDAGDWIATGFAYTGGNGSALQGIGSIVPNDVEIRFTGEGIGYDNWDGQGNFDIDFEVWNVGKPNDDSDDYRLIVWVLDDDGSGDFGLKLGADHGSSGGNNDPYTDRFYVMAPTDDTPGEQGHDNWFAGLAAGGDVASWVAQPGATDPGGPMDIWAFFSRSVFMIHNGGDVDAANKRSDYNAVMPEIGTIFYLATKKPITGDDVFTFSTAPYVYDKVEYSVENIKVWPNPYFGFNPEERNPQDQQMHFTHLPETGKCKIRIFDLVGNLVRIINHNDAGSQYTVWDLKNTVGEYVASGMYIAHFEYGSEETILKLAVIEPDR